MLVCAIGYEFEIAGGGLGVVRVGPRVICAERGREEGVRFERVAGGVGRDGGGACREFVT